MQTHIEELKTPVFHNWNSDGEDVLPDTFEGLIQMLQFETGETEDVHGICEA
jgi:hypothetical protein